MQVVAQRHADPLVAIRKRLAFAGAAIAAPFVPCDETVPERDDGHLHARRTPLADVVLRFGQQRTAQSFGLTTRIDRQHSQMPRRGVVGGLEQDASSELRTLVVAYQQQVAVSCRKSLGKRGRICPRSGKQPDLVGPALLDKGSIMRDCSLSSKV